MWHVPDSNYCKSELDQKHRMCKDCLVYEQYVESALNNKQSLDATKREQQISSNNNPIQYL